MRIPEVTRTITMSVITALAVNTESKTVEEVTFTLPRKYEGEEAVLKYLSKNKAIKKKKVMFRQFLLVSI